MVSNTFVQDCMYVLTHITIASVSLDYIKVEKGKKTSGGKKDNLGKMYTWTH